MKWLDRFFGGPKDMAALPAGTKAPDFSLPAVFSGKDGGKFSLQSALKQGPVLAAFGGPMYYGHSPDGYSQRNVWNYQTRAVESVWTALSEAQRRTATMTTN